MGCFSTSKDASDKWLQPVAVPSSKGGVFGTVIELLEDLPGWEVQSSDEESCTVHVSKGQRLPRRHLEDLDHGLRSRRHPLLGDQRHLRVGRDDLPGQVQRLDLLPQALDARHLRAGSAVGPLGEPRSTSTPDAPGLLRTPATPRRSCARSLGSCREDPCGEDQGRALRTRLRPQSPTRRPDDLSPSRRRFPDPSTARDDGMA